MATLSAVIITLNEAPRLPRCLRSLDFCDEIVVVDSGSTDDTCAIARQFTDIVLHRDWTTYADQKNFAISKSTGDWVFCIDADEWVPPDLAEEIREVVEGDPEESLFYVGRRTLFLGRWMDHCWSGDLVLRLFRRGSGEFRMGGAHESFVPHQAGPSGRLSAMLYHDSYRNLEDYMAKLNDYTTRGAEAVSDRKARRFGTMFFHAAAAFGKMYILKRGFLDGSQGLLLSILSATSVFVKYAKAWERAHGLASLPPSGNRSSPLTE